jgi:hypothetical protein
MERCFSDVIRSMPTTIGALQSAKRLGILIEIAFDYTAKRLKRVCDL